jgi:cytoskeletal protein CcmA (bactofilin family)
MAGRLDPPRRLPDLGGLAPASVARRLGQPARPEPAEGKRLTVGRDISLSGEIASCDVLAVEGTIDATLSASRAIEVADTGVFRGTAEVDVADIAGTFQGDLIVRERLQIRATGRVTGTVRYAALEIELGGVLAGDIQPLPAVAAVADLAPMAPTFGVPSDEPVVSV